MTSGSSLPSHSPLGLSCGPWLWEMSPDVGALALAPCPVLLWVGKGHWPNSLSLPPVCWLLLLLTHFKPVFFPQVQGSGCPRQPEDAACLGGWVVLLSARLSFIVSSSSRIPVCLLSLVPLGGAEIRLEAEPASPLPGSLAQECPRPPAPMESQPQASPYPSHHPLQPLLAQLARRPSLQW